MDGRRLQIPSKSPIDWGFTRENYSLKNDGVDCKWCLWGWKNENTIVSRYRIIKIVNCQNLWTWKPLNTPLMKYSMFKPKNWILSKSKILKLYICGFTFWTSYELFVWKINFYLNNLFKVSRINKCRHNIFWV